MVLKIIENKKIKANQKEFNRFLERYHNNEKTFTIDCDHINLDYFNSESYVTIRHKKPNKESIYYTSFFKEKDEITYLFGLAREPVVWTSSYMDMGAQIRPKLVAVLNLEDSSKSNIVFAEDSEEYNNVILLRIDCSQLNNDELTVLKNKNKITKLKNGKGFINFGAIGDFTTLKNIRNFISNVTFEYDNGLYAKIINVSIPINNSFTKPDSDVLKDRFYNFDKLDSDVVVIDPNEDADDSNQKDSEDKLNDLSGSKDYSALNNDYSGLNKDGLTLNESYSLSNKDNSSSNKNKSDLKEENSSLEKLVKPESKLNSSLDLVSNMISELDSDIESSLNSNLAPIHSSSSDLYRNYLIEDNEIYLEMSISKDEFFKMMKFLYVLIDTYTLILNNIEVLDTGDGLLNICSSILMEDESNIKIIEAFLINNDFEND